MSACGGKWRVYQADGEREWVGSEFVDLGEALICSSADTAFDAHPSDIEDELVSRGTWLEREPGQEQAHDFDMRPDCIIISLDGHPCLVLCPYRNENSWVGPDYLLGTTAPYWILKDLPVTAVHPRLGVAHLLTSSSDLFEVGYEVDDYPGLVGAYAFEKGGHVAILDAHGDGLVEFHVIVERDEYLGESMEKAFDFLWDRWWEEITRNWK